MVLCKHEDWGMGKPDCDNYERDCDGSNACKFEWFGECKYAPDPRDARIAALEAQLREREAECERLGDLTSKCSGNGVWKTPDEAMAIDEAGHDIVRLARLLVRTRKELEDRDSNLNAIERAESAEQALAAAREENERLRKPRTWDTACKDCGIVPEYRATLAALKSRSEGRVERVAAELALTVTCDDPAMMLHDVARAVLAAADREGE